MSSILTAALEYAQQGIVLFPVKLDKTPAIDHWDINATSNLETIREWFTGTDFGIGVPTGQINGFIVLDVDVKKGKNGKASLKSLEKQYGKVDKSIQQVTGSGGLQFFYKSCPKVRNMTETFGEGIDVRGSGGYVVLPPSMHPSGNWYEWVEGCEYNKEKLPDCPAFIFEYFENKEQEKAESRKRRLLSSSKPVTATKIKEYLSKLAAWRVDDYECWRDIGFAIHAETQGSQEGFELWTDWSSGSDKFDYNTCQRLWDYSFDPNGDTTIGTLIHYANEDSGKPSRKSTNVNGALANQASDLTEYKNTDSGFAEMFYHYMEGNIRFNATRGKWYIWNGSYWRVDEKGEVVKSGIEAARLYQEQMLAKYAADEKINEIKKQVVKLENKARLQNMLSLASVLPEVATVESEWDYDGLLLGCENGVVDLRTGEFTEGQKEFLISKSTRIEYDPTATCPRWIKFLGEVFENNQEVIDYVQRSVGYTLTSLIKEQCFFTLIGNGRNGKSVFLKILGKLMGDYSEISQFETFEHNPNGNGMTNDLAKLSGCRLTVASESSSGSRGFNEARLKSLTGGDGVTARFLNKEFFSFVPTFKIWLSVNEAPRARDNSDGFWRRIKLINFPVKFNDDNDDKSLFEKLLEELPGILNWAIDGCLAWQKQGLNDISAVKSVVETYREANDPFIDFVHDVFVQEDESFVTVDDAYNMYVAWADSKSLRPYERQSKISLRNNLGRNYPIVDHENKKAFSKLKVAHDPRQQEISISINGEIV